MKWILIALAILLASASPATAAAPERPQVQACDEDTAPWRVTALVDDHGLPIGSYTVWSCVSLQDLLDQAAASEAEIRQNACERYGQCEAVRP